MKEISRPETALIKLPARRTTIEVLIGQPPEASTAVYEYLGQVFEKWLAASPPVKPIPPFDSPHMAAFRNRRFINEVESSIRGRVTDAMNLDHSNAYTLNEEERNQYVKETDSMIALLKYGWKARRWINKGGLVKRIDLNRHYSVPVVGWRTVERFDTGQGRLENDVVQTIRTLSIPPALRNGEV